MFKTNTFKLLLYVGISSTCLPIFLSFFSPQRGIAQEKYCQVEENNRKLPSSMTASSLNASIESAMKEASLQGEVEFIVWADGVQIYNYHNGQPKISAPHAKLYPVENLDNELYLLMKDKSIGNHYLLRDKAAWEFGNGQRFIAQEKKEIEGGGEKDVTWLAVKVKPERNEIGKIDRKEHYILRIHTKGGVAPDCNFEGSLGMDYQTLYGFIKTNGSQVSQSSVSDR